MTRQINVIAREAFDDWKTGSFKGWRNSAAAPYLLGMLQIDGGPDARYGLDSGKDLVLRFIANAEGWRGETARRIKKELKLLVRDPAKCKDRDAAVDHVGGCTECDADQGVACRGRE